MQHVLVIERGEVDIAGDDRPEQQHRDQCRPASRIGEHLPGQHRRLGALSEDDERHPQKYGEGEGRQGGRVREAVLLALAEPEDQQRDRPGCQDRPGDIESCANRRLWAGSTRRMAMTNARMMGGLIRTPPASR